MADQRNVRNNKNNRSRSRPPPVASTDFFQKWNGGKWEKVNLALPPTAASPRPLTSEDDIPMRVMEFMGLPKSCRKSFYTDLVEDVQEIVNLPSQTAATLLSIVSWVLGDKEAFATAMKSRCATPVEEEHLVECPTQSNNSLLAGPDSTIQIPSPFQLSLTDVVNVQESEDNVCRRFPSRVSITTSHSVLNGKVTSVYSYNLLQDGGGDKADMEVDDDKTSLKRRDSEQKVTFESSPLEKEGNVYTCAHQQSQETIETVEETEERDFNQNCASPPQQEYQMLSEMETMDESSQMADLPLPCDCSIQPGHDYSMPSDPAAPQPDLDAMKSESNELVQSTVVSTHSSSPAIPVPSLIQVQPAERNAQTTNEIGQLKLQETNQTGQLELQETNQTGQLELQKTNQTGQLELQETLKKLEDVVKGLYKTLNMNKNGPLRIVANFIPKEDGNMRVNIQASPNVTDPPADNQEIVQTTSSLTSDFIQNSFKDSEPESNSLGESTAEESKYGAITVKVLNKKSQSTETTPWQEDRSTRLNWNNRVLGPWKSDLTKFKKKKSLCKPLPTGLNKRPMSFLDNMAVMGQAPIVPNEESAKTVDEDGRSHSTLLLKRDKSKVLPTLTNKAKPSSTGINRDLTSNPPNTEAAQHSSSGSPSHSLRSEDFQSIRGPSSTTEPTQSNCQSRSLRSKLVPAAPRRPLVKTRIIRSPSELPLIQPFTNHRQQSQLKAENCHSYSFYSNSHQNKHAHVVKACSVHGTSKIPVVHHHPQHHHQGEDNLYREQQDYTGTESDASTSPSSYVSTTTALETETGSEEMETDTTTATELERDPIAKALEDIDKALNFEYDYCQRPVSPKVHTSKSKLTKPSRLQIKLPFQKSPFATVKSEEQSKFRAPVYIPSSGTSKAARPYKSYREIFQKKKSHRQNIVIDLTSKARALVGTHKKDSADQLGSAGDKKDSVQLGATGDRNDYGLECQCHYYMR